MIPFLFRRLLQGLAILFMVATVTFALIHAAPGEPFAAQLEDARFTPEMSATLRRQYGLDAPLTTQYARFLTQLVRGDLGIRSRNISRCERSSRRRSLARSC